MTIQDKEMLNDLIVESREHLSEIEPDLLELEQKGDAISGELINRIFRAVHSIKGGFGFFGIEHVTKLSHAMENVMAKIRDKNLSISPPVTEALLKGVDKLRVLLDDVGHAEETPIDSEVSGLNPFLDKPITTAAAGKSVVQSNSGLDKSVLQKHPDLTDDLIAEAMKNGKLLYQIGVNSHSDLSDKDITPLKLIETWEKLGDILDVSFDFDNITGIAGSSDKQLMYSIIFSSVLEPDLISTGTGIPDEQIFTIDLKEVKSKMAGSANLKTIGEKADDGPIAGGDAVAKAAVKTPADKSQKTEIKIEDALRVKVGLLNNLMNLAGELVLSRNQLMQSVGRKLSESVEIDMLFKNIDRQVSQSFKSLLEDAKEPGGLINQSMEKEHTRIKDACLQDLSIRLIDIPGLNNIIQNIDMVTSLLQESIMQTRLQPISVVFAKFPRLVRDLAKKLNKEIELTLVGQDVELDKSIIEQLSDPLTHLIRNSVDHGVELPEKRARAGKQKQGQIILRAFHEGGKVHIQIEDDGAGINRERVKEKAVSMGLLTAEAVAKMSDREIDAIIMLPGFSTATVVSDVSGRGVGMDVVSTNIERLGGTVEIDSVPGHGTVITMKLPLTLAIISSLIVSTGGRRFAIPQVGIEELVRIRANDVTKKIERLKDCEVIRLRGKLLPLIRLADALGMTTTFTHPHVPDRKTEKRQRWSDRRSERVPQQAGEEPGGAILPDADRRAGGYDRRKCLANAVKIIVCKYGERHFGLVVEDVYDNEEIVVKPLSGYLKSCQCYAGSTIMGDGSVAMIIDTNGIAVNAGLKFGELEKDFENEKDRFLKESGKKQRELLLFATGESNNFGVDLSMVARVEKVKRKRIETIGGKEYLKYDDRSMRLIRLSDYLPVNQGNSAGNHAYVIVPKDVKYVMGIVAESVKDIIRTDATLDCSNIRGQGILGSAIIGSALTVLIDVQAIFKMAEPGLCA
jgi:two-component system, chemotaxis family, sensor kinase CheA